MQDQQKQEHRHERKITQAQSKRGTEQYLDRYQHRLEQVERLNKHGLNQEALRWLRSQPKSDPVNREQVHCLQLMLWGIDHLDFQWPKIHTEALQDILLSLDHSQNPAAWFRLLLGPQDEPNVTDLDLKEAEDKDQAAWMLLDGLDRQLVSLPENNGIYPPEDPLRLDGD